MPEEKCAWKGCRNTDIVLVYIGKPLCQKHWMQMCGAKGRFKLSALKLLFGDKRGQAIFEGRMK